MSILVTVGVDVGGTNTDAVVLHKDTVLGSAKTLTTSDVTNGVSESIRAALDAAQSQRLCDTLLVQRVHIGTTQFVNAVVQAKSDLAKVCVLRLCGPSSKALPPFSGFPEGLKKVFYGGYFMADGGFEYDSKPITDVNEQEIKEIIVKLKQNNIRNVVISGIFSPVDNTQEQQVGKIFSQHYPEATVTLSHEIGNLGLLERENASVLNESLKPLCAQTVHAFRTALNDLGLTCDFFLTQNDGTLISSENSLKMPVHTFASGPTNSMRGAAFLSGVKHAVVVDIGGTSTDVGMLVNGFPRKAPMKVKVAGVRTNFRMPDLISIGLGGGSIVNFTDVHGELQTKVGPQSTGFKLITEGLVFGGATYTATDMAVAAGLVNIGDPDKVKNLPRTHVEAAIDKIYSILEKSIDQIKTSGDAVTVILVGGGTVLVDKNRPLKGTSNVIIPPHHDVANAVGAAMSQVSGATDRVESLENMSRQEAIEKSKSEAIRLAVTAGANPQTIQITEVMEVPLAYIPGNVTRVKVNAVGDLLWTKGTDKAAEWRGGHEFSDSKHLTGAPQLSTTSGKSLTNDVQVDSLVEETEPRIENGEWILSEWDIECLAVGAGILGCGGGGSAYLGKLRALNVLRAGKQIKVVTPERIISQMSSSDIILPVGEMGAPTIWIERIVGLDSMIAFQTFKDLYKIGQYRDKELHNKHGVNIEHGDGIVYIDNYKPVSIQDDSECEEDTKVVALFCVEIGGSNCIEPLIIGGQVGLPVVDCDCMGRAFPELHQITPIIYGHPPHPACLADHRGQRTVILYAESGRHVENYFRRMCINMGCAAGWNYVPLKKNEISGKVIPYSISRAWRLGNTVLRAQKLKTSPVMSILGYENGHLLLVGKISDVERRTIGGFARGGLLVEGIDNYSGRKLSIKFQNENLVAKELQSDGTSKLLACTPDLISLVENDSGEPIPTEEVKYGLRVAVLVLPASPMLLTPEALAVIGPQAFGYPAEEVSFKSVGGYREYDPISPR